MGSCRAYLISALLSMSWACTGVFAEDKPMTETLIDLLQNKKLGYQIAWSDLFLGEHYCPQWIEKLDAVSKPSEMTSINGKDYVFASMCKTSDNARDRILALFSSDRKKCWAVGSTIPPGLAPEFKFATLRYFGNPDPVIKNYLASRLEKMFAAEAPATPVATTTPAATTPEPATPTTTPAVPVAKANPTATTGTDFSPQNDEAAKKFRGELHAKKGVELMKAHNYRQAEAEFKEAARNEPDNIQYLEGYAEATNKANDYKEAILAYGRLLKADPAHHPEAHGIIADSLRKLVRNDEAVEEYKKAVAFEKDKAAIWHKIAEIRLAQAKIPDTMDAYRNAIKVAPSDGKAYRLLASMEWNQGNKADALRTYRSGAQNAPRDGELQAAFAYALMSEQQWQEAANAYKAAAMLKGTSGELEAGYKSAMDHLNYEQQVAKQAAEAAAKKKKKH